jgi:DNA-binding winged helix-turn-helix (wHTH) protein
VIDDRRSPTAVRFGPFLLDSRTWSVMREAETLDLSPRLVQILAYLIDRAGATVTKDELLDRFWPDVNVTENTLARAIADIRKALADDPASPRFVQTLARRGYRFIGEASHDVPQRLSLEGVFHDWVKGRLALESLDEARLPEAQAAFEHAVAELPGYAPARAGLANAYLLRFEASRIDGAPDETLLHRGVQAARDACRLDPTLGEAWAALGHLLTLAHHVDDARAAARQAAALEPGSWRHQFRLALATWGEERLRATDRTLALMPGCAPAHLLAAMVFVARGALPLAANAAATGAEWQDRQRDAATPLPAAGCWWLLGLINAAAPTSRAHPARDCFEREIAASASAGIYGREFATRARAALAFIERPQLAGTTADAAEPVVERLARMLADAKPGPVGWMMPIDPMLAALRAHPAFERVLATLAARAA